MSIEIGTPVIHTRHAGTYVYDGEHESGPSWTAIVAHVRDGYTGILAPVTDVAPAGIDIPAKSDRVTAYKAPTPLSYGPKQVWRATVDGLEVAGIAARTRKDALEEALRTMTIRDFHAATPAAGHDPHNRPRVVVTRAEAAAMMYGAGSTTVAAAAKLDAAGARPIQNVSI